MTKIEIEKLSPDKLMSRFTRSGIMVWIIAAFALHVVVLGGTSVDYIHGMVDPAWKDEQDRIQAEALRKAKAAEIARAAAAARAAQPASAPTTKPARKSGPASAGKAPAAAQANGRTMPKELTTMPKPGEIPVVPGAGLSIEETERK